MAAMLPMSLRFRLMWIGPDCHLREANGRQGGFEQVAGRRRRPARDSVEESLAPDRRARLLRAQAGSRPLWSVLIHGHRVAGRYQ